MTPEREMAELASSAIRNDDFPKKKPRPAARQRGLSEFATRHEQ